MTNLIPRPGRGFKPQGVNLSSWVAPEILTPTLLGQGIRFEDLVTKIDEGYVKAYKKRETLKLWKN